jgi:hypothetical protein
VTFGTYNSHTFLDSTTNPCHADIDELGSWKSPGKFIVLLNVVSIGLVLCVTTKNYQLVVNVQSNDFLQLTFGLKSFRKWT